MGVGTIFCFASGWGTRVQLIDEKYQRAAASLVCDEEAWLMKVTHRDKIVTSPGNHIKFKSFRYSGE